MKEKKKKDRKSKKHQKQDCPDFLEKGVCTKGEACNYEHAGAIVTIDNDRATNDDKNKESGGDETQAADGAQTLTVPATNTEC